MMKENTQQIITEMKTLETMEPADIIELATWLAQQKAAANKNYGDVEITQLQSSYQEFLKPVQFQIGQLVKWKPGLKNRTVPHQNQPAMVIEILETPIYEPNESGTPYFREPLDIALAIISDEGDFLIYHYDKRRFQPYF